MDEGWSGLLLETNANRRSKAHWSTQREWHLASENRQNRRRSVRDDDWNLNHGVRIEETAHINLNDQVIRDIDLRCSRFCESWGDRRRGHEVDVEVYPFVRLDLDSLVVVELDSLKVLIFMVVMVVMEMMGSIRIRDKFRSIIGTANEFDFHSVDLFLCVVLNSQGQGIRKTKIEDRILEPNVEVNVLRAEEALIELVNVVETDLRKRERRVEHG
jgi:hypothetical protein